MAGPVAAIMLLFSTTYEQLGFCFVDDGLCTTRDYMAVVMSLFFVLIKDCSGMRCGIKNAKRTKYLINTSWNNF